MRRLLFGLLLFTSLRSETIDRIAITIDRQVVTELQIDEELRVTAFLNSAAVSETLSERRVAADRIVEQTLVAREMQLSHYPDPPADEVDAYLARIRATYPSRQAYTDALGKYLITEAILKSHLAAQLRALSFIEIRFRPDLGSNDISAPGIEKREELTDQILDTWLEEARKQVNIIYLDKALQ